MNPHLRVLCNIQHYKIGVMEGGGAPFFSRSSGARSTKAVTIVIIKSLFAVALAGFPTYTIGLLSSSQRPMP